MTITINGKPVRVVPMEAVEAAAMAVCRCDYPDAPDAWEQLYDHNRLQYLFRSRAALEAAYPAMLAAERDAEYLRAERDAERASAYRARAEAAERERDALLVVARAARAVAAWKEPIQMLAPELGGSLRAIYQLEAALDSLPPEVRAELGQSE